METGFYVPAAHIVRVFDALVEASLNADREQILILLTMAVSDIMQGQKYHDGATTRQ